MHIWRHTRRSRRDRGTDREAAFTKLVLGGVDRVSSESGKFSSFATDEEDPKNDDDDNNDGRRGRNGNDRRPVNVSASNEELQIMVWT